MGGAPLPVQKKHEESSLRGWMESGGGDDDDLAAALAAAKAEVKAIGEGRVMRPEDVPLNPSPKVAAAAEAAAKLQEAEERVKRLEEALEARQMVGEEQMEQAPHQPSAVMAAAKEEKRKRKIAAPPQTPWAYPLPQPMLKDIWPVDYVLYYVNALSMTPEGVLSLDVTKARHHIKFDLLDLDTRPDDEKPGDRKEVRERLDHDLTRLGMKKIAVQERALRWLNSDFGLSEKQGEDGITVGYLNVDRLHRVAKFIEGKTEPDVETLTLLEKWWGARKKEELQEEMREKLLVEKAKAEELKKWSRSAWSELAQNIVNAAKKKLDVTFSAGWLDTVFRAGVVVGSDDGSDDAAANWLEGALQLNKDDLRGALIGGVKKAMREKQVALRLAVERLDELIDIIINNISKKAKDAYEQEVPLLPEQRPDWLRGAPDHPMSM